MQEATDPYSTCINLIVSLKFLSLTSQCVSKAGKKQTVPHIVAAAEVAQSCEAEPAVSATIRNTLTLPPRNPVLEIHSIDLLLHTHTLA